MADHGILLPRSIAATNNDTWQRSATSASAVDNGYIVFLGARSAVAGEGEVFVSDCPLTGSLSGCWMVYQGDEVVITDSRFKGIDPDIRNFYVPAGDVFSVYKPQVGDIIRVTVPALSASQPDATYMYVNATNNTMKLTWGTAQTASATSYRFLASSYVSLATGSLGETQRVLAYDFECVAV